MAIIYVRESDYSVIQGAANFSALQLPPTFKRGTTPQVGVVFVDENGAPVNLSIYATGVRTFVAQPAAGDVDTINGEAYTWKAALTGAAYEILIGASLAASIANFIGAVNAATVGGQAAGTTYGNNTAANLYVSAALTTSTTVTVTSLVIGAGGNAYTLAVTGASGAWSAGTLTGGTTAQVIFGAKPSTNPNNTINPATPQYDGNYIVNGSTTAQPDANGVYWLNVSFSNPALNTLLGYNPPNVNDDVSSVILTTAIKTVVGANIEETTQFSLVVWHDINQGVEAGVTQAGTVFRGTLVLANGVSLGTVTGQAWPAAPQQVLLQMNRATGNLGLETILRSASKTTDGFTFDVIGGPTDTADYSVDWLALLPA